MKLLKSSILSFLAVLIRGVSALSINKLFAVIFGPDDFGLFAHFQNLTTIYTTTPNDGVNRGVIRYLSPSESSNKIKQKYFAAGLYLNIILFTITTAITLLFPEYFISKFETNSVWWYLLFSVCMFLLIIDYFLIAVVLAFKNTFHYLLIEALGSAVFFSYLYISLNYYSETIQHALLHYMFAISLGIIIVLGIIFANKDYKATLSFKLPKKKHFKKINTFLIMALVTVILQKGLDFSIREFSLDYFGKVETGIWQSVVKLSDYYMMAFTSVMMISFYPQISSSLHNKKIFRKVLFDAFKLFIPIIFAGVVVVYLGRNLFLEYLFDESFLSGEKYVLFQVLGDFLKMTATILGLVMLAQAKLKWFVFGEILSALSYLIFIGVFKNQGIDGLLYAHFLRYIVYFLFLISYYRKLLFSF